MANELSNSPPNLDDGELWLPSDIFLNEAPSKFKPLLPHHLPFSCMDDLAPRFASLSLPKHQQKLPKATNFERLKEPVCCGSMNGSGFKGGQSLYGFRTGPFLGGTKPVHEFQFLKPTPAQVESYVEARARVLQRQQNRLIQNRHLFFAVGDNQNSKGVRNRQLQESQVSSMKRVGVTVAKQEDCYYHLPAEMGLPRDWTY
ncbi:hypothetical protein QQP08_015783 [Theobroma cacao]|nr:hypothetical protein QQP08_015783 [Theobroma cacao]